MYWKRHAGYVIFASALLIRLIYVAQVQGDPFYTVLTFDSKDYDRQAHELLQNGLRHGGVYLLGPLYVFFLAAAHLIAGHNLLFVMAVQAVLGAMTCVLVYKIGELAFDQATGATAAAIAAVYGPLVFYTAIVLTEPVLVFVNTALVYALTKAYLGGGERNWLFAGAILGVSSLGKPNILVLAPAVIALNWLAPGRKCKRTDALWLLAGAAAIVAPVMLRNTLAGGVAPVTGNFGVNLYIGNHPNATGTYTPLNDLLESSGDAYHFRNATGPPDDPGRLWGAETILRDRSLRYIMGEPLDWAALMLRKLMLYANVYEIPDMDNYNFLRDRSILPYMIGSMAWIAPLGLLGIGWNLRSRKAWPAMAYVMTYGLSFILFFVKARFRIALMPIIILFAADAIWRLARMWQGDREKLVKPAVALILLFAAVNNPYYNAAGDEDRGMLNPYNNLGKEYSNLGETGMAIGYYLKAVEYNPRHYESYNNLGEAYNKAGEHAKAEDALRKAVLLDPDSPYARNNLGTALFNLGRSDEALQEYKAALKASPYYFEAHSNLGTVYFTLNRTDDAASEFRKAADINPRNPTVHYNLAAAYHSMGYAEGALLELRTAAELDAQYMSEYQAMRRDRANGTGGAEDYVLGD